MWTLECDSPILESKLFHHLRQNAGLSRQIVGKRIWLRPGKKYLFGRTKEQSSRTSCKSHFAQPAEYNLRFFYSWLQDRRQVRFKEAPHNISLAR